MTRQHCTYIDSKTGARRTWFTDRLWRLAGDLPIKSIPISSIAAFDQNTWFGQTEPTCRNVAVHAKRISEVAFEHPTILASEGWVMGRHAPHLQGVHFGIGVDRSMPDRCLSDSTETMIHHDKSLPH